MIFMLIILCVNNKSRSRSSKDRQCFSHLLIIEDELKSKRKYNFERSK